LKTAIVLRTAGTGPETRCGDSGLHAVSEIIAWLSVKGKHD